METGHGGYDGYSGYSGYAGNGSNSIVLVRGIYSGVDFISLDICLGVGVQCEFLGRIEIGEMPGNCPEQVWKSARKMSRHAPYRHTSYRHISIGTFP